MASSLTIKKPTTGDKCTLNYIVVVEHDVDANGVIAASCGHGSSGPNAVAAGSGTTNIAVSHTADHLGAAVAATFTPNAGTGGTPAAGSVGNVDFMTNPPLPPGGGD